MNNEKVLFVDDDPNILKGVMRQFEDEFDIHVAEGPHEGLRVVREDGPFAVVFSDMRMPDMNGIEFLTQVQDIEPESIRLMLTGYADLETTIDAINKGHVFRFLSKPCSNEVLRGAIEDGLKQFRLVRAEKELVEGTLMGSVKVLSEVLSLVNPAAFGRASRVQRFATAIAEDMKYEDMWELKIASMLCVIGCVTLSESVLEKLAKHEPLSPAEENAYKQHPEVGRNLLSNIPRLENVAQAVAYQEKQFDGAGYPNDELCESQIPMGARILKVALDFDIEENLADSAYDAYANMLNNQAAYDPTVLAGLNNVLDQLCTNDTIQIEVSELLAGMILAEDVVGQNEQLLVAKGQEITRSVLNFLFNYAEHSDIREPVMVLDQSECRSNLVNS